MQPSFVVPAVVLAALAVAPCTQAGAASPGVRTVTVAYAGSGLDSPADPAPAQYVDARGQGSEAAAISVDTARTDQSVAVRLTDDDGMPVLAAVVQHLGADARSDVELGRVCGPQARPLPLARPGAPLTVYLLAGRCGSAVSAPTRGTATLTFRP